MSLAVNFANPAGLQRANRRVLTGVGISLALHALFLLAYRTTPFDALDSMPAAPAPLTVTIAPPAPAPEPLPMPEPAPIPAPIAKPAPPVARKIPAAPSASAPPQAVIAVPESSSAEPDPFVVQQPETPPPATAPTFDMDAARRVARANAHLRDPAREGTALAQFPEPPLQTESKLARGIARAKRADCKDGIPGGLLAPIYLMMDKKDSGCKW